MEYTKDVIFNTRYKKETKTIYLKYKWIKKIIDWVENDNYFTVVILTSIIVLTIDFLVIKRFIDLIKLL